MASGFAGDMVVYSCTAGIMAMGLGIDCSIVRLCQLEQIRGKLIWLMGINFVFRCLRSSAGYKYGYAVIHARARGHFSSGLND